MSKQADPTPSPAESADTRSLWAMRLVSGLLILLTVAVALWPIRATPAVEPAAAPAERFSAERALAHLRIVAAEPHPIGSARNALIRDHLVEQIRALGLQPEVQRTRVYSLAGQPSISAVENVLIRVRGSRGGPGTRALLVSGHYDSIATTAGAADCGGCVATLLEALRAVVASAPLRNDVIFLFTDGEEVGVAGATAFMQQHPSARDVALSLVWEGYGPRGASLLYVADRDGGQAVSQGLAASSRPLAYSFLHGIMWSLANNTGSDLDAFLADGAPGMAFINLALEGAPAYHTLDDSAANLDVQTLQSHGLRALELIRHFGNADLTAFQSVANPVYFTLAPGWALRYPASLAMPLALLASALLAVALAVGVRKGRLRTGGIAAGLGIFLVSLVVAMLLVTLKWWALRWLNVGLHDYRVGGWYGVSFFVAGFCAMAFAVAAGGWWLLRRVRTVNLWCGNLVAWALLALIFARGGASFSYALVWPLLIAVALLLWWVLAEAKERQGWGRLLRILLPLLAGLLLITPIIYVLGLYSGRFEALSGLPAAALPTLFVMLLAGMAIPVCSILFRARYGRIAVGALIVAAAFLIAGWMRTIPSPARPAANTIVYWLDTNQDEARWIAVNDSRMGRGVRGQADEWTTQFLGETPEVMLFNPWPSGWVQGEQPSLYAPAPVVDLPRSNVEYLFTDRESGSSGGMIRITPPAAALDGQIVLSSAAALTNVVIDDYSVPIPEAGQPLLINHFGEVGSMRLEYGAESGAPITLILRDRYPGLPEVESMTVQPRPATMIPAPLSASADSTIVEQAIVLD